MATFRKLQSGKWNAQVRNKGKVIASSTHRDREVAVGWAEAKEQQIRGDHPLFLDAGHSYCHEVLERKPSQLIAFNRIDRICRHRAMQNPGWRSATTPPWHCNVAPAKSSVPW